MIAEIYEALVEAGASEEKAKAAAGAVPVGESLATKADIQAAKDDIQELWSEIRVLKFAVFTLYPFVIAITYRIFS
ncbi:MAG: integrase [Gammaproteobacteria bacterium]|nr:integrase [Gammaproteobacteria bacterium]MDE0285295.1 integrase [Gammaproteobacteria bacterium]MDE0513447.1 integrase [Gammaproteobacteria bacterium]